MEKAKKLVIVILSICRRWNISWFLIFAILSVPTSADTTFLQLRLLGTVGGGNYSYYSLSEDGTVTVILYSLQGDADLYMSEKVMQPTFDLEKHSLQSVTCGLDVIDVPAYMPRPLIIGVYGHPSHDVSIYELEVIVEEAAPAFPDDTHFSESAFHTSAQSVAKKPSVPSSPSFKSPDDERGESMLWTIFVSILKVMLEVLAN